MQPVLDIIIVGGGPVGLALANALLQSKFKFRVIEAQRPALSWPNDSQSLRVSALNCATQKLMSDLAVWDSILQSGASRFDKMYVWDAVSRGAISLAAEEVGEADLGFIVENRALQRALWQAVAKQDSEALLIERCEKLSHDGQVWHLQLSSGVSLCSKLVVGADGVNSWLRRQVGIVSRPVWYGQRAIVANVQTERMHERTAYQRFLPSGPLAFLPLKDPRQCSIVWTVPEAEAQGLCDLAEPEFNRRLTAAFAAHLGNVEVLSDRASFPLMHQHAAQYVLPGVALLGDAAHSIHPLAGQGVNLGFADAKNLAEVLLAAHELGRPFASLSNLQRYERERRGSNALMLKAMNGFNGLFSNDQAALSGLRGLGLSLVDKLGVIKKVCIKTAMGLA